jgi:hypothetical protein
VPLSFVAGLLRSRLARAAVAELVVELGNRRSGQLRHALGRALGDPSLRVAYSLGDDTFVDLDGSAVPRTRAAVPYAEEAESPSWSTSQRSS